jgi:hypothetical protein
MGAAALRDKPADSPRLNAASFRVADASKAVCSLRPQKNKKPHKSGAIFGGGWTRTSGGRSRGIYSHRQANLAPLLTTLINLILNILCVVLHW